MIKHIVWQCECNECHDKYETNGKVNDHSGNNDPLFNCKVWDKGFQSQYDMEQQINILHKSPNNI